MDRIKEWLDPRLFNQVADEDKLAAARKIADELLPVYLEKKRRSGKYPGMPLIFSVLPGETLIAKKGFPWGDHVMSLYIRPLAIDDLTDYIQVTDLFGGGETKITRSYPEYIDDAIRVFIDKDLHHQGSCAGPFCRGCPTRKAPAPGTPPRGWPEPQSFDHCGWGSKIWEQFCDQPCHTCGMILRDTWVRVYLKSRVSFCYCCYRNIMAKADAFSDAKTCSCSHHKDARQEKGKVQD